MKTPYPRFRVWWVPQVPMKAFHWPVYTVAEGQKVCDLLAQYDEFQYANNIKPDYSNVGGIEYWDLIDEEWCDFDPEFDDESSVS